MSLNDKPIHDIKEPDLQALVAGGVPEGKTIEYKLSLPGSNDSDKKEFLADISSLANTAGGDIVYGMMEEGGIAAELIGLAGMNLDAERLRLEEIIRNGIDQRITNLIIAVVPLLDSRAAVVIRVPRSFGRPHMVTFKGSSRFYGRNSAGKYQLDISELRAAFLLSETFAERAREFRVERLSRILAAETPVRLKDGPIAVLHIIPVGAFESGSTTDLSKLVGKPDCLRPLMSYGGYMAPRYNFDGIVSHGSSNGPTESYVQLFRNGTIEGVLADLNEARGENKKNLAIGWIEKQFIEALPLYLQAQQEIGIEEPVFLIVSLLGVLHFVLNAGERYRFQFGPSPIDKDTLLIPEILIENKNMSAESVLRPIFDVIWNAAGWPRSMNYDENGNRKTLLDVLT